MEIKSAVSSLDLPQGIGEDATILLQAEAGACRASRMALDSTNEADQEAEAGGFGGTSYTIQRCTQAIVRLHSSKSEGGLHSDLLCGAYLDQGWGLLRAGNLDKATAALESSESAASACLGKDSLRASINAETAKRTPPKPKKEELYAMLNIEKNATLSDVKRAYRKKALEMHPDKMADEDKTKQKEVEKAEENFRRLAEAYAVLSDDSLRKKYDTGEKVEPPKPKQSRWIYIWDSRDILPNGSVDGSITPPDGEAAPGRFNTKNAHCEVMSMSGRYTNECHGKMSVTPPSDPCKAKDRCIPCMMWRLNCTIPTSPEVVARQPHQFRLRLEQSSSPNEASGGGTVEAYRVLNHIGLVTVHIRCSSRSWKSPPQAKWQDPSSSLDAGWKETRLSVNDTLQYEIRWPDDETAHTPSPFGPLLDLELDNGEHLPFNSTKSEALALDTSPRGWLSRKVSLPASFSGRSVASLVFRCEPMHSSGAVLPLRVKGSVRDVRIISGTGVVKLALLPGNARFHR